MHDYPEESLSMFHGAWSKERVYKIAASECRRELELNSKENWESQASSFADWARSIVMKKCIDLFPLWLNRNWIKVFVVEMGMATTVLALTLYPLSPLHLWSAIYTSCSRLPEGWASSSLHIETPEDSCQRLGSRLRMIYCLILLHCFKRMPCFQKSIFPLIFNLPPLIHNHCKCILYCLYESFRRHL